MTDFGRIIQIHNVGDAEARRLAWEQEKAEAQARRDNPIEIEFIEETIEPEPEIEEVEEFEEAEFEQEETEYVQDDVAEPEYIEEKVEEEETVYEEIPVFVEQYQPVYVEEPAPVIVEEVEVFDDRDDYVFEEEETAYQEQPVSVAEETSVEYVPEQQEEEAEYVSWESPSERAARRRNEEQLARGLFNWKWVGVVDGDIPVEETIEEEVEKEKVDEEELEPAPVEQEQEAEYAEVERR